jgi:hypothetical protein
MEVTMRMQTISLPKTGDRQLPSRITLTRLFIGGFTGLMIWEIWARLITPFVLDGPLEPAGLVTSLVQHWTGYELSRPTAEVLHYIIGIVGYPVAYYGISRTLRHWAIILDGGVWLLFTGYVLMTLANSSLTPGIDMFWIVVTLISATRIVNKNSLVADCLSWGSFTWFNALGIMAPIAGLPFLLLDWGGGLSFMSYVGHVIYGFVAAFAFELWEAKTMTW